MATGVIVLHGVELANDNATQTTELPEDGPWNLDPIKLSQAAGNTVAQSIDNGNGALVPDIDAPWALSGEQLSQITNNSKPIPPAPKPIDPSTQSNAFNTMDLFARLVNTESGGKHTTASGSLLTSNKGAQGITQVLPKTGTDPGFGVTPIQNNSKEEYLRFGKDYLTALVRFFGGDETKAVAAYNAGPGTIQKLSQKYGDQWQTGLPTETKKYVKRILG